MQLRRIEDRLKELGVATVVISFDHTAMAEAYVQQTHLRWPLLFDENRTLYRAYGMESAGWWAIYGPQSVWQYLKLIFSGRIPRRPGRDWRQVGGDVLVDPQGIVRFHFVSQTPHDRPETTELLRVIDESASGE